MLSKEIIREINESFKNVILDDGIGYFASMVTDTYGMSDYNLFEKDMKKAQQKDKERGGNWHLLLSYLSENQIDFFACVFMDSKGIKYILPCFLLLENKEELCYLIPKLLTYSNFWGNNIWGEILTIEQKNVIIKIFRYWNDEN